MARSGWILLLLAQLLSGCGGEVVDDDDDDPEDPQVEVATAAARGSYKNPVLASGCADPGAIRVGGDYYVVCTGGGPLGIFVIRHSKNLIDWADVGAIFPPDQRPSWTEGGDFWAPEIRHVGDRYVAYFSARSKSTHTLAIGAAWAKSPLGPYTDRGEPLVDHGGVGVIDPSEFNDPATGKHYLLWKVDGNAHGEHTPIYLQPLDGTGLQLEGKKRQLIHEGLSWEISGPPQTRLVEAPHMVHRGHYYYLFYSGNGYAGAGYAVGVARSATIDGTFRKHGDPILKSNDVWRGPGHSALVHTARNEDYLVYHAWDTAHTARMLLLDRVRWQNGWPHIHAGTPGRGTQPRP